MNTITDSLWSSPEFISFHDLGDRVEVLYKQVSLITPAIYPFIPSSARVVKIIYSCVEGKWHKSEPIFGKIIPAQPERYEFDAFDGYLLSLINKHNTPMWGKTD